MRQLLSAFILCLFATTAIAEPTEITVRVISKGAKFVGTSMGGVSIQLVDSETGEVLAQGVTSGSTGDTNRIMRTEHSRNGTLSTDGAAKFDAQINIETPRLVRLEARGPIAQAQSFGMATATQWVVPGKHVTGGDGWVVELPGLVVDVLAPPAHVRRSLGAEIELNANVTMMCGCPITPDGLWDARQFDVEATILHNGAKIDQIALEYAGQPSQFSATYKPAQLGAYQVIVVAHQPINGNTGLDRTTFIVVD